MAGRTSVLTLRWTSSASVPRGQLKTLGYLDRTCSVVDRTVCDGVTVVKLSLWAVMMFMS